MFQHKKTIVYLVLAMVISLIANWKYIFKEKTPATVTAPATDQSRFQKNQAITAADSRAEAAAETLPEKKVDYRQMTALDRGMNWGPDPFGISSKPEGMEADKRKQNNRKPINLRLESILITPSQSLAVINNRLLTVGDTFQGKRISRITGNSVIMEIKGNLQELKLGDYGIPMVYIKTPVAGSTAVDGKGAAHGKYQGNQLNDQRKE